jgi:FKBP-type peptidyl-prolyl cis-trans isomerase (trigger factor)
MNIAVEKQPKCLATLRAEIPADKVNQEREKLVRGFARQAKIPGFRPGKVPRKVIEKRFGEAIDDELQTNLVREAIKEALNSPLIEADVSDATGALINVVGGENMTVKEAESVAEYVADYNRAVATVEGLDEE